MEAVELVEGAGEGGGPARGPVTLTSVTVMVAICHQMPPCAIGIWLLSNLRNR